MPFCLRLCVERVVGCLPGAFRFVSSLCICRVQLIMKLKEGLKTGQLELLVGHWLCLEELFHIGLRT